MLNLITTRKLGGNTIPASLTTLSVSWLNGQFKAVAVDRGAVQGSWERPGEDEDAGQFETLIREAVARTNYQGKTVSLVLAHPRLVQQLVDVPPVKRQAVQKIIRRQAQQQKLFPGEAVWACQTSLSAKGTQRVILHLFPRPLLDQLVQGCQRNGLDLVSVVPVSAVLHHHLMRLPLEQAEAVVLAADTGGSTTVVIGRKDGQLLLVRTLSNTWNENVEKLAVDLNRTMLFVSQQSGVTIDEGVWLFGAGAREQALTLQGQMQLPVSVSPVEYQPTYWATDALKLRPDRNPNFLSAELQKAPQRRAYAKVVAAGAVLLVLGAIAASGFSLWQARQETANISRLRQHDAQLQTRRQQLQQRNADLSRQQQLIKLVLDRRPAPVPLWFLGYLGEVVPPELVVTNLHLKREDNSWKVQMATAWQAAAGQPAPSEFSNSVARLRAQLSNGPFHLAPLNGGEKEAPHRAGTATKPATGDQFVIEGIIR
jgi:type II secretory pathway pseudopilin PulG